VVIVLVDSRLKLSSCQLTQVWISQYSFRQQHFFFQLVDFFLKLCLDDFADFYFSAKLLLLSLLLLSVLS